MRKQQLILSLLTYSSILWTHGDFKIIQILFLYAIVSNFCGCLCLRAQPTHTQEPSRPSCAVMRSLEVRQAPQDIKPNCSPPKKAKTGSGWAFDRISPWNLFWSWSWLSLSEVLPLLTALHCPLCCQWLMELWKAGTSVCICVTSVWCQVQFRVKRFHAKGMSEADFM